MSKIELKNVSYRYMSSADNGQENSVDSVTLTINEGEAVAFIGTSGCGKTTLTRLINGLAFSFFNGKAEGALTIDGEDIQSKKIYEIGKKVGSVFQNPKSQFFASLVEDEIAFALENFGVERTEIEKRINMALTAVNGEHLWGKNVFCLSSGERQKLAAASIYAFNPPVYVFDEPSANLDMQSIEALKQIMLDLKQTGKTLIVSEHRLYYLKDIIDVYYLMQNGRLTARFTKDEFLALPRHVLCEYGLRAIHLDSIPVQGSPFIDSVSSAELKQFTENRQNTEPVQNTLSVVNLSFGYGKTCLFHNLNYTFTSGQVYGIIGMNGTGKTTFAKILCGLIRQKKGTVIFSSRNASASLTDGFAFGKHRLLYAIFHFIAKWRKFANPRNLKITADTEFIGTLILGTKKLSAVKRKRLIYYLANNADSNLFGVSAIEELKLNAPFAELHAVQALLDEYRLLEKAEAHPFSLSGGQKQRLTLAAAEMLDREVFILDEPTSGLDAANMRIIANRTAQLKQQGKIVIIISHDYEFLLASCDTILAMNKTGFTALCPKHDKEKILERLEGETAAN